MPTLNELLVRD